MTDFCDKCGQNFDVDAKHGDLYRKAIRLLKATEDTTFMFSSYGMEAVSAWNDVWEAVGQPDLWNWKKEKNKA